MKWNGKKSWLTSTASNEITTHERKKKTKQAISYFTGKKLDIRESQKYPLPPSNLWSISTITHKKSRQIDSFLNILFN